MVPVLSVSDPVPAAGSSDNAEGKSTAEVEVPELRQRNGAPRPRSARAPADRAEAAARRAEVAADKARAENAALAAALEEAKAELARLASAHEEVKSEVAQQASAHRDLVAIVEAAQEVDDGNGNESGDDEGTEEDDAGDDDSLVGTEMLDELVAAHPLKPRDKERLVDMLRGVLEVSEYLTADLGGTNRLGVLLNGKLQDRSWFQVFVGGFRAQQPSRALALHFAHGAPVVWLKILKALSEYFGSLLGYGQCEVFSDDDRAMLERFHVFWFGIMSHFDTSNDDARVLFESEVVPGPLRELVGILYYYLGL